MGGSRAVDPPTPAQPGRDQQPFSTNRRLAAPVQVPSTLLLAAALLSAPVLSPSATAQSGQAVEMSLALTLHPEEGTADLTLSVTDPGNLRELRLGFGDLSTCVDQPCDPELRGDGWTWDDDVAVVDLTEDPDPQAVWTTDARITVVSNEGTGHTSYVGDDFSVIKVSDLMPEIGFSFPEGDRPVFSTTLSVERPSGWQVEGPWEQTGQGFLVDGAIPRGFLAIGPDLERATLGDGAEAYDIVRVDGAREDASTRQLLEASDSYLAGIYGSLPINRFIVVAPDPMFRGGLASPEGIFLHADADAEVVAHELVHAFQGFQVSRTPGQALVWLVEGSAVVDGARLEVAAGLTDQAEVIERLQSRRDEAQQEHGVDLTTAVYGSGNERAAYTKGAVVTIALNDAIRGATGEQYTLADVLTEMTQRHQDEDVPEPFTTQDLQAIIGDVTGYDFSDFFERFVTGQAVPELGAVFPGEATVRILGTDPAQPIALEPFTLQVAMANLDVTTLTINRTILVDGSQAGRLVATLEPGQRVETDAAVSPLPRGTYTLTLDGASHDLEVVAPARLNATIETWPDPAVAAQPVTVGVVLENTGEADATGSVRLLVDGDHRHTIELSVPGGERVTVPRTVEDLTAGEHTLVVQGPDGRMLASRTIVVTESQPLDAPGLAIVAVGVVLTAAAALAPGRRRRR